MTDDPRPVPDEELVPEDDAIIGRAFRLSLLVIVGLVVAAVLGLLALRREKPVERVIAKDAGAVSNLVQPAASMPQVHFKDVTAEAGIGFVHTNGARGDKLLPETMGSGAAFFDADADGDQDLLLVNSTDWPGQASAGRPAPTMGFFVNDGAGRFADATRGSGLDVAFYGTGVAVADWDGDSDVDVFVTALGPDHLFRNDGGRFVDVTAAAGVGGGDRAWGTSTGFFDYDNDGDLDLFVCSYVDWSKDIDFALNFTLNGRDRAYGPPTNYEGTYPHLYRNEGGGRFTDVSAAAGIRIDNTVTGRPMAKGLGLAPIDVDGDGFMDVFVANDTVQNFLFHNRGDGTFEEIGARSGVGYDSAGKARGAMGIDTAHYRNDALLGVAIGNFANEMTSLFVSQRGDLQFTDEAMGEGIGAPSRLFLKFGVFFFDYDLDGRLDLLETNGHLENEIAQVQASQTYRQPAQLFWNAGPAERSCFAEVPRDTLGDLSRPIVGRGATYADIDGDGDLDVLLTQVGGPPLLLRNDQQLGHHWLRVKLVGAPPNTDAIGAWIEVEAGGNRQRRQVMPVRSYLSQVELPVTFGLADAERVEVVRVRWPNGSEQQIEAPEIDRVLVVRQAR